MILQVNQKNIDNIKNNVIIPQARPDMAKICHIGVGNFHRAHQAVYTEDAMQLSRDNSWGIFGVAMQKSDTELVNKLNSQDGLYTLLTKTNNKTNTRIVGSIVQVKHIATNLSDIIKKIADPNTQLITLTVTEGGYHINQNTGTFISNHPDISSDIKNPEYPQTIYGLIVLGLLARKNTCNKPITLLSCDNIPSNGDKFKNAFETYLNLTKNKLSLSWLRNYTSFPNCMVDRITPKSHDSNFKFCEKLGFKDECCVSSENYKQWIIEDNFVAEKPPWELAGVQFVKDVTPYEKIKLHLLNASHLALAYPGKLLGYDFVSQAMENMLIKNFISDYMSLECELTLQPVSGVNIKAYQQKVIERFSNHSIADSLDRIISFSSDKLVSFVLPSLINNLQNKRPFKLSAFLIASFYSFIYQDTKTNEKMTMVDNQAQNLYSLISKYINQAEKLITKNKIFEPLSKYENFIETFREQFQLINKNGIESSLREICSIQK